MNQNEIDALGRHIAENAEGSAFKKPTPTTDRDELVDDLLDGKTDAASLNPMGIARRPLTIAEMRDRMSKAAARIQADAATIAGMQWQPIETAPRDGTRILIAMPRDEAPVCEAWWAQDYENGPGYWSTPPSCTGRGYTILPTYPTHWMPLPNPPALKGGDHG